MKRVCKKVCRIVAGAANACVFTAGALIGGVGTCVACEAGKYQMATAQTSCAANTCLDGE